LGDLFRIASEVEGGKRNLKVFLREKTHYSMDNFDQLLAQALKARPGITKERLAAAMGVPYDDEFRARLDQALDGDQVHKIQDKYYPGTRKAY
jgi:hypothetical protein